jgi:hypothetical protein
MEISIGIPELFRIASIFMGILVAYFTYRIYVMTKGGSKGWKYMAITGASLFLWATFQVIFSLFITGDLARFIRIISGTILFPIITIYGLLCPIALLKDMEIKKHKFLTERNAWYYFLSLMILLLFYNLLLIFPQEIFSELLSVAHDLVPLCFIFATYGYYLLWKGTKKGVWIVMYLGTLLIVVGTILNSLSANCCGTPDISQNLKSLCQEGYRYDYVASTPIPCELIKGILPFAFRGSLFILIGVVFYLATFYKIYTSMEETTKGIIHEKKFLREEEKVMENIISETINETLKFTGKIIGKPLAVRLISKPLERIKTIYQNEIKDITIFENKVDIEFTEEITEEKMYEILENTLLEIKEAYSKIIGIPGRTMVRKGLSLVMEKYKDEYPLLEKLLKKL